MWPVMPDYESSNMTVKVSFYASIVMVAALFVIKWYRRQRHHEIPARDVSKGHRWCFIDIFSHPALCNICQTLMVNGAFCDSCGVCADHDCIKTADKELFCKSLSGHGTSMKHHWICGNLLANSICDVCEKNCGIYDQPTQLVDYKCCWCQRTVHTSCLKKIADVCDLGKFRNFIVPPTWFVFWCNLF